MFRAYTIPVEMLQVPAIHAGVHDLAQKLTLRMYNPEVTNPSARAPTTALSSHLYESTYILNYYMQICNTLLNIIIKVYYFRLAALLS